MSGRYTNVCTFAYDASGDRHLVTQEYSYSSGCGEYHHRIDIQDKFYRINGDIEDVTTTGTYLPFTYVQDYQSYFAQSPTETIQTVLRKAELTGIEITSFLMIVLLSVNAGVYEAFGYRVSPEGVSDIQFDIKEDYAHDIDLTFNIVLTMAELENQ